VDALDLWRDLCRFDEILARHPEWAELLRQYLLAELRAEEGRRAEGA
jgi:hypothetical protein